MTDRAGRLIAFEGIDGCGKSTQARILAASLGALLTHEPGATALGLALRRIVLGHAGGHEPVARAEALLVAADRAQHVTEVVRPALDAGRWVVTDRFSASTLAYQGYGKGLAVPPLAAVVDWAAAGIVPDLTVLVDVPLDVARARLSASPDRLERLDEAFFERVRAGYLEMAGRPGARPDQGGSSWVVVDGSGPVDAVRAVVASAVKGSLGEAVRVGDPAASLEP